MKTYLFIVIFFCGKFLFGQFGLPNEYLINPAYFEGNDPTQVGDVDGDGDLDIICLAAISNYSETTIAFLERTSLNEFAPIKNIECGLSSLQYLRLVDMDNDQDLDLFLCNSGIGNATGMYKMINDGGGNFSDTIKISNEISAQKPLYIIDINSDGYDDIVYAKNGVFVSALINLGNWTFQNPIQIIPSANFVNWDDYIVADINSDGLKDIVCSNAGLKEISCFYNNGNNTYSNRVVLQDITPYNVNFVRVADVDQDLDPDIICFDQNRIGWLENPGTNNFSGSPFVEIINGGLDISSSKIIDFNNDGYPDLLYSSEQLSSVFIIENLSGTAWSSNIVLADTLDTPSWVDSKDIDNDGDLDVLGITEQEGKLFSVENVGGTNFNEERLICSEALIQNRESIDFNGDGFPDIIAYGSNFGWHRNNGDNTFSNLIKIANNEDIDISAQGNDEQQVFPIDFEGDGDVDIVYRSLRNDSLVYHENDGLGNFSSAKTISGMPLGAKLRHVADMDQDGDLDWLIVRPSLPNSTLYSENMGSGSYGVPYEIFSVSSTVYESGDIDNDGDIDVLVGLNDRLSWYENDSSGLFNANTIENNYESDNGWIALADLDSNGWLDIVVQGQSYFLNNLGLFQPRVDFYLSSLTMKSGKLVDIDLDGDLDIINTNPSSTQNYPLVWLENDNLNFEEHIISDNTIFRSIMDIDLDGDLDVFGIKKYPTNRSQTIWFENYFESDYKILGQVFYDANQNGEFDGTDYGIEGFSVEVSPSSYFNFALDSGKYVFHLDDETYIIESFPPNSNWDLTTDSITYTIELSQMNMIQDSINFGYHPNTNISEIEVSLTGGFPRCNDTVNYWLNVKNIGTTNSNGVIQLKLHPGLIFIGDSTATDSIVGNNFYWSVNNFPFFSQNNEIAQIRLPSFASAGDTLTSILSFLEHDGMGNTIETYSDTLVQLLVCAYDPNDKTVAPIGLGTPGYIENDQELEYLIRFQNTGNDTAINIVIIDKLDTDLDHNSYYLISSSHSLNSYIDSSGVVEFRFSNINLPDSTTDFLGSQGFVKFKVAMNSGLLPLTEIENTAEIYFDFNPPIITNTTLNTIQCEPYLDPVISMSGSTLGVYLNGNYEYSWYLNDTLLFGQFQNEIIASEEGGYKIQIRDSNNCIYTSSEYNYFLNVNENESNKSLIYPNPNDGGFTVKFSPQLQGRKDFFLMDVMGRIVFSQLGISSQTIRIETPQLEAGIYFPVVIKQMTKHPLQKLVIK